jgi:hypothetical protein
MNAIQTEIEKLDQLSVPDLVARHVEVFGKPPRSKHRRFLMKRIAFKVAEAASGGLSEVARKRLAELMAEIELPTAPPSISVEKLNRKAKGRDFAVGTSITRSWRGQEVVVTVVDGGFMCNDVTYKSLSAVAKAVTGAHWNGNLFFGVTARRKAK